MLRSPYFSAYSLLRDPVLPKKNRNAGVHGERGAPSGVQGQSPWSGVRPPEVESILKCRLQIFAVKYDENPTVSTLLFFLVQLCSYRS